MLQESKFADFEEDGELVPISGPLPIKMRHSDGTALPLVLDATGEKVFGADIIRFEQGKGVGMHKHLGSHILLVMKGTGVLTFYSTKHDMFPGMIYLVPSNIPHAISASTELVLIAIGNDHRPADSEERLDVV